MKDNTIEQAKGLDPGLHVLSISISLMRVTDPLPEKLEDLLLEIIYYPRQPSSSVVQGFPFKDRVHLSMGEVQTLVDLFKQVESVYQDIEEILGKISCTK